ncbi:MAG: Na+/H+ antiporter NhaA [Rhodospirillaceae bacterium]|nr:Na+/H+ antiporter NhaA [Rhodospirillaceae bacterium]
MPDAKKLARQEREFESFVHSEVLGSIILLVCAVVALVWANSPWSEGYFHLVHTDAGLWWGADHHSMSLQHWINDGLMVIFFFVVGLEIKRELLLGHLSSFRQASLPVMAALGGVLVPAGIYFAFNFGTETVQGWGIPMATDIAFALGILAMFGKRVPIGLKVFLTALAIADDLAAVLVIALFYTQQINFVPLIIAGVLMVPLLVAFRMRLRRVDVMMLLIIGVWAGVFASGIHATVAGVLMAFLVPVKVRIEPQKLIDLASESLEKLGRDDVTEDSMIEKHDQLEVIEDLHQSTRHLVPFGLALEHYLHPLQTLLVLPLFALFNAGVSIGEQSFGSTVSLGIVLGLFLGKPIGIMAFSWLTVMLRLAKLPEGVNWGQIFGTGCLAGVGFTMSIFITDLAFDDEALISDAKLSIVIASVLAGIVGYVVLRRVLPKAADETQPKTEPTASPDDH